MSDESPALLDFVLIEDNEDHAMLVQKTLRVERMVNQVHVFKDGETALKALRSGEVQRPPVILLDLNLPGMSGFEVLKELKSDLDLKTIPVVVLTTSNAERDRAKAYAYAANSYLTKPVGFEQFRRMIKDAGFYWGVWNEPPS